MINKITVSFVLGMCLLLAGCGADDIAGDTPQENNKNNADKNYGYTWMTMALPWKGVVDLPFVGNPVEKKSEVRPIELNKKSSYTLYLALGSVEYQVYNVVRIKSSGEVVAAYKDPETWEIYQKKFMLTGKQLAGLTKVLIKNNAGDLPASAITSGEESVLQGGLTLVSGGRKKRSYFSDSWLKQFKNIVTYVNNNILKFNSKQKNNGYTQVKNNILQSDPEATKAIRGLIIDR